MASVLVTGAAGFAGSHLVDLLAQSGALVTGWRRPGGSPPQNSPNITWQLVDLLVAAFAPAGVQRRETLRGGAGLTP